MGKKKKGVKAKGKWVDWEKLRAESDVDEGLVAAYARVMSVYQRLEDLFAREGLTWVGKNVESIEADAGHWLAEMGERLAALGGHLELVAVLPKESVTLLSEPEPASPSETSG